MEKTSEQIRLSAESDDRFNYARLLLLFKTLDKIDNNKGIPIERIAYYDFFSAQPFLIFGKNDETTRVQLLMEGFESTTLSYISSSQRFTNRRAKLKHFLCGLLMWDMIEVKNIEGQLVYSISNKGREIASMFRSFYTKAYLSSAEIVIKKLKKLSDKKLNENAREWLRAEPFVIDLYDF